MVSLILISASGLVAIGFGQDNWGFQSGMNQGRSGLGVAVADGCIYAVGGYSSNGFCSYNEQYNSSTGTWILKSPMPTARGNFAIASFQNKIYCMGGCCGYTSTQEKVTGANEVYDPVTDSWEIKMPMPTPGECVQAGVVDGKIYVIGENNEGKLIEIYDPTNDSWILKAPIPMAVGSCASVVADGKIYVFSNGLTQIYNPENDNWTVGTPAPSPLIWPNAVATTGLFAPERIYVFGVDAQLPYWQLTTKGFITQSYDPKTGNWTIANPMQKGRYGVGIAVMDDKLFLIGGFTIEFSSTTFDINPTYTYSTVNELYKPVGYGSIPLTISLISPQNTTYGSGHISLAFTTNRPVAWEAYSLDGQAKETIGGNITLAQLPSGLHSITVYAQDSFGNTAAPQTVTFSIAAPTNGSASTFALAGLGVTVLIVGVGSLVFLKKNG